MKLTKWLNSQNWHFFAYAFLKIHFNRILIERIKIDYRLLNVSNLKSDKSRIGPKKSKWLIIRLRSCLSFSKQEHSFDRIFFVVFFSSPAEPNLMPPISIVTQWFDAKDKRCFWTTFFRLHQNIIRPNITFWRIISSEKGFKWDQSKFHNFVLFWPVIHYF